MRVQIKRSKSLAGSSYTDESSRALIKAPKKRSEKVNLMLTISLNQDCPVVDYEILDCTYNKQMFIQYINNRTVYYGMDYDIIDRASFYILKNGEIGGIDMTLSDTFENQDVTPLYLPTGYPEFNPVEQAFSYLKRYVATARVRQNIVRGWTKDELTNVIVQGLSTITHNM